MIKKKNNSIPPELQSIFQEIAGVKFKVTNNSISQIVAYGRIDRDESDETLLEPDDSLEYIFRLITDRFIYRSVLIPSIPKCLVGMEDLKNPRIWNSLVKTIENDFLRRIDDIPRNEFEIGEKSELSKVISTFRGSLSREDRRRVDPEKLRLLALFIYDYVQLSFKEMALNQYIKQHLEVKPATSTIIIDGETFTTNPLLIDILTKYVNTPQHLYCVGKDGILRQVFNPDILYVPDELGIEQHPKCNVNNMTAMFYDLFRSFFISMNLTKRKGAILSEQEKDLIATLAKTFKICETSSASSVTRMYNTHQGYFEECELYKYIRENEYGRLLLNTCEKKMFYTQEELENQANTEY